MVKVVYVTTINIDVTIINIQQTVSIMTGKRDKARGIGTVIAMIVAIVVTVGVSGALHLRVQAEESGIQRTPMPVSSIVYEEQQSYSRDQRFLGLVQAATRSQIGFEVPGAIAEIHVFEGQMVEAGTALATLDTKALNAQREAAASSMARVAAELELAKARTERQQPLRDSGAISEQTFDDTRLAEKALASAYASAKAELSTIDINLEKSVLRAPYAARVGRQLLDRGTVTNPGTPVFSLVATQDREAQIGVAVEQAVNLQPGESYPLTWRDQTVMAKLRAVRPDINPVSMTAAAIFELPPQIAAFDGEPVGVSIPRNEPEAGGWLPLSSLLEGERGVWTVLAIEESGEGLVTRREVVEVLHVSGDQAFVRGSLRAGDAVVADGIHRIAPGTLVSIASGSNQQLARS